MAEIMGEDVNCQYIKKLLEPCKEPRKLTKREHAFCEYAQNGWLARDIDKRLFFFKEKPHKNVRYEWYSYDGDYYNVYDELFPFITWKDNEPYSVEGLLTWEVEDQSMEENELCH